MLWPKHRLLKTIAQWVVKYGGGECFELVKLLQSVSKQFGGSVLLGAEFLTAVVDDLEFNFSILAHSLDWHTALLPKGIGQGQSGQTFVKGRH